ASQVDFAPLPGDPTRVQLGGTLAGGSVRADGATVTLERAKSFPYQATLVATRHSIKPYFHVFNPRLLKDEDLTAFATGKVSLAGALLEPALPQTRVTLNDVQLNKGPHALSNRDPISFAL